MPNRQQGLTLQRDRLDCSVSSIIISVSMTTYAVHTTVLIITSIIISVIMIAKSSTDLHEMKRHHQKTCLDLMKQSSQIFYGIVYGHQPPEIGQSFTHKNQQCCNEICHYCAHLSHRCHCAKMLQGISILKLQKFICHLPFQPLLQPQMLMKMDRNMSMVYFDRCKIILVKCV